MFDPFCMSQYEAYRQFLSFLGVGLTTAIIYFSVFALMLDILHIAHRISTSVSYFIAVSFHFSANRFFVFQPGNTIISKSITKYLIVAFLNYVITIVIVEFSVSILDLSPYVGLMASVVMTVMTGFVLLKYWVFHTLPYKGTKDV